MVNSQSKKHEFPQSVPRPAGRPRGFGETFGKLCGLQKTGKKLAGRPAGFIYCISDLY
jgi:hypothetical protein